MSKFNAIMGDLGWPDGRPNPSGVATTCYFIPKSKIASYPELSTATDLADAVVYDGEITLKTGAVWNKLYSTQGFSSLSFESIGEKDCKTFVNKAEMSFPDIANDPLSLASGMANSNMLFIVPHFVAGGVVRYAVFGSANYDAEVTPKGASGSKPGDRKSTDFSISASDFVALPSYVGTIKTADGTLDCETGEFTPVVEAD